MRERGIMYKFRQKYWFRHNQDTRLFSQVEISDVSPIFIILGVGSAIAFFIFFLELLNAKKRENSAVPIRHLKRFDYYNQLILG